MLQFSFTSLARRSDIIGMSSEHTGSFDETGFPYIPPVISDLPTEVRLMKMRNRNFLKSGYFTKKIFLSVLLLFSINVIIHAQFVQQGGKLVGTGSIGGSLQGASVSLSADGNTAIVGGDYDNSYIGAAWIFTRNGDTWSQQGGKLVGTGRTGQSYQGSSAALSADGNTAIVGGPLDNNYGGAAWIYTRSGGTWTQQGGKLVGTGGIGSAVEQGCSVSLSADGNTAIVGGLNDNNSLGAAWIYTRSGGTWTQQGAKLVGTGSIIRYFVNQGESVSLSGDGNTALIGGSGDNNSTGAAWVFTRSGGTWTQQGDKLVGTGYVGSFVGQGWSVSLSADGNTAIVGGAGDNSNIGASWVYTRSGGTWTQQGDKLVGTGNSGGSQQGWSVSLSGDGNTVIVGGWQDNSRTGAAWVFTRSGETWSQKGGKLVGTGSIGDALQGYSVSLSEDGTTAVVGGAGDDPNGAAWVYVSALAQTTLTIQSNAEKCNYVSSHFRNKVQADSLGFNASRYPGGAGNLRSFLQFDLLFIPPGSKVNWARLSLFALPNGTTGANSSKLRRITSAWDPNTVTWNNQPATTTRGQLSLSNSTNTTEDYKNLNVTNLVQAMVDSPETSYGFALKLDAENGPDPIRMQFYAPANGKQHKDPKLALEYTPPGLLNQEVITLELNYNSTSAEMSLSPNPSNGIFNCSIKTSHAENRFLRVIDVFGRTVYNQQVHGSSMQLRVTLSLYSSGTYFVILEDNKNAVLVSQKLIVN